MVGRFGPPGGKGENGHGLQRRVREKVGLGGTSGRLLGRGEEGIPMPRFSRQEPAGDVEASQEKAEESALRAAGGKARAGLGATMPTEVRLRRSGAGLLAACWSNGPLSGSWEGRAWASEDGAPRPRTPRADASVDSCTDCRNWLEGDGADGRRVSRETAEGPVRSGSWQWRRPRTSAALVFHVKRPGAGACLRRAFGRRTRGFGEGRRCRGRECLARADTAC